MATCTEEHDLTGENGPWADVCSWLRQEPFPKCFFPKPDTHSPGVAFS